MNTLSSKARAAALVAGATIAASAAMAPSANAAWTNFPNACTGASTIYGGGAAFQQLAQLSFGATMLKNSPFTLGTTQIASLADDPLFSPPTAGFGFSGPSTFDCENFGTSVVKYTPIGSGAGRNSWRANGTTTRDTTAAFVAPDEAPDPGFVINEQMNLQKSGMTSTGSPLETIPVAQASNGFVVNLPAGCTSTGRSTTLSNIEKIFEGDTTTFNQLLPNRVTGAGCNTPVNVVVRSNSSGTTFATKTIFASIDSDWNAFIGPTQNTQWPIPVTRGGNSNVQVVTTVANTPGTIAFGDLGSIRSQAVTPLADFNWNGAGDSKYMVTVNVPLRGGTPGQTVSVDPALDSDATNGISSKGSNCGLSRQYSNLPLDGAGAITTKGSLTNSFTGNWYQVNSANPAGYTVGEYPVCTLTYVLAYDLYSRFPGMTEDKARTAADYIRYITSSTAQNNLFAFDYQKLPAAIRSAAGVGSTRVSWK